MQKDNACEVNPNISKPQESKEEKMSETAEGTNICNPQPLKDWVQGGNGVECRSCYLGPVVQWYRDELDERGLKDLAKSIEQSVETATPVELAGKLDEVKAAVSEEVRNRLKEFDCALQSYNPKEQADE